MPSRVSDTPGAVPFKRLILELRLSKPEHKVRFIAFVFIVVNIFSNADLQIVRVHIAENIVVVELGGVEVYVSAREVGVALVH